MALLLGIPALMVMMLMLKTTGRFLLRETSTVTVYLSKYKTRSPTIQRTQYNHGHVWSSLNLELSPGFEFKCSNN